ncbi:GGDEF domain-containing protein, partial [Kineosporia sp. A_224]|uniref:GGDEF domain-containing protein n=1 Tax=Kineosporia sp. A_224 TaxID=1962180 RepID=UPI00350FBEE3
MSWSVLWNRPLPGDLVPADVAERHEIRSTDVATGTVVVAAFVSVVGYGTTGRGFPGGTAGSVVVLVGICLFAARESLLGRLRARLTTQLRRQARIDPLTGLVNRRGLTERIRRIPAGAEWSVLALDLDGFKAVNDVHGHAAGDEVLVVVAEALRALAPDAGVAARTGGDEFAVLTPGDVDAGRQLGNRIAAAVREQVAGLGLGPRITVSVGVGRVDPAPGAG